MIEPLLSYNVYLGAYELQFQQTIFVFRQVYFSYAACVGIGLQGTWRKLEGNRIKPGDCSKTGRKSNRASNEVLC
jgi:hypothetical protein